MELSVLTPPPPAVTKRLPPVLPRGDATAGEVIDWLAETYAGELAGGRVAVTTSFGMEGCVLIDLLAEAGLSLPVIYLDTGFFFQETHDLRRRLVKKYPALRFVDRGTDLTPEQQAKRYGPRLWDSDPAACCNLRKVEPMRLAMENVDVWLTALRRGQSPTRADLPLVGVDPQYDVVKVSPLAAWDRPAVWEHVRRHNVPYNALHERGYPTVGCTHCTRAVPGSKPWDYTRAGRWAGKEKTECGLHFSDSPLTPDESGVKLGC